MRVVGVNEMGSMGRLGKARFSHPFAVEAVAMLEMAAASSARSAPAVHWFYERTDVTTAVASVSQCERSHH